MNLMFKELLVVMQLKYRVLFSLSLVAFLFASFPGCTEETHELVVRSVTDEEAVEYADQVLERSALSVADGFEATLWASEKLLSDPVGIHVDDDGRVYVTITERRRNAEIDIRGLSGWMIESIELETVDDRRELIRRKLAPEKSANNQWLEDYNRDGSHDWRDLKMGKESVLRIEDTTGDGYANRSQELIRDFHDEITDVAGAVLFFDGDLFVGVSPDLWRIRDTNGDGYGNDKKSILHGFGTNIGFNGHGMSGLTTGPDGRLYWAIGDVGLSVVDNEGKRWHYPRQGMILRSEPDGSDFEVFAAGLRNTHEFVFDKYGNLITVDNDGDHAGEFERLVYLVSGSDSGWRLNWQFGKYNDPKNNNYNVLMDEEYFKPRFEGQAAHLLPPLDRYISGPSGMTYNPGTALSEEWKDHFFVGKFVGSPTNSGIHAFTLKESGASFQLEKDEQILEGLLPTSLDFGPDGAIYFTDWIEGWTLKQKGRIWKFDTPNESESPVRMETKSLLDEDFTALSLEELSPLLAHEDMRVRQKAQFELAARSETETLQNAIEQRDHQLARIHGIWGLAQISRQSPDVAEPLISYLDDADSEIRAQAAKLLGDVKYEPAGEFLIPLLQDDNLRVRFFAAEALGRISWRPALDPIIEMLEVNNDEDIYLRHGGAIALERIGDENALTEFAGHSSRAVRIAALVALTRLESPGVVQFLEDEDEFIVTNAARAINDDKMIEEGLEELSKLLEQDRFLNEPLMRRAINATLYRGSSEGAHRLATFAVRDDIPEGLKIEALQTLAVWPEPSVLDRVTGDPRGEIQNDPEIARNAAGPIMAKILSDESSAVKIAGLQTAGDLNLTQAIPDILQLIEQDSSADVRIASLRTLVDMKYEGIDEVLFVAMEDEDTSVRRNALRLVPELNLPAENMVAISEMVLADGTIEEKQSALRILGDIDDPSSYEILNQQMDLLMQNELDNEIELDLVLAAEAVKSDSIQERLRIYQSEKNRDDSVAVYRESLYGGDASQGREIFYQNAAAQCIRCHVVDGQGSDVGPDLTNAGNRLSRSELLRSMVDPDARISPGYGTVTLTLNNGETIHGMLSAESDTHLTVSGREQVWEIEKENIAERVNSPSGMPAMGNLLTRDELRDLVEFLTKLQAGEN